MPSEPFTDEQPAPPTVQWKRYFHEGKAYFHNADLNVTTWQMPDEPYVDELVEWRHGDAWTHDVNFRCGKCGIVKPLCDFGKKSQKYSCDFRVCKSC